MTAHAILAPSSAARWMACPGSVQMEQQYPETEESQDALEGTATHWAAQELFADRVIDIGLVAPNGIALDAEMIEAAEIYYDDVRATLGEHWRSFVRVESRVYMPRIHEANWGTPDCFAKPGATIYVWDFKYGHRYVDVFENWQLLDYAEGILAEYGLDNGHDDQRIEFVFRIVQPRCFVGGGPIREWRVNAALLRVYFTKLQMGAAEAMSANAKCKTGPQCRDCKARHTCDTLQRAALGYAEEIRAPAAFDLPTHAASYELRTLHRAIEVMKARADGLEEQLLRAAKGGQFVPHFRLEPSKGCERWSVPETEVIALGDLMGISLAKPNVPTAVTPAQARKLGVDAEVTKAYSIIPNGEIKLVPDNNQAARKIFGQVTE